MTLKEELEARIKALNDKLAADMAATQAEIKACEAHLSAIGPWLEQEADQVSAYWSSLIARIRTTL